jgi:hypothetical protein
MNDIIKTESSRVSAQVPVNTRVTSNAKRLKAVIADDVLPSMIKAIKSEKTSPETVVKLGQQIFNYHLGLETLAENTLTDRLRIELQAFGPTVKAKEIKQVDEEDDHFDGPSLTDEIISV